MCGSAAWSKPVFEHWQTLTGQTLPGVSVKLVDEHMSEVKQDHEPGEILVKGDSVFLEYWNNPEASAKSFVDGWFRTGDMAVMEAVLACVVIAEGLSLSHDELKAWYKGKM